MAELSTGARNVQADAQADLYDGGVLEIRSGAPPGAGAADAGTLLASITLPTPAFGAAANGVASLAGVWQDAAADAAGTAGHYRIKQSGDAGGATPADERIEGSVGATGSGSDLELQNTNIAAGQAIEITAFAITQPAGAPL